MVNNVIQLFTEGKIKTKDEREFTRLVGGFGDNKPIITTKQISELIGYDNSIVTRTINRNIKHFNEDIDIIDLKSAMPEWQSETGYTKNAYNASKNVYILSQSGFLLYLKFAEGDSAVDLYKDFIEDYFKTKAENVVMKKTLEEEIEFLNDRKRFLLGSMFMEQDANKKIDLFNECEKINNKITEIEVTLSNKRLAEQFQTTQAIADKFTHANVYYDIGTFSKVLKIKDLGRNNLFEWLRSKDVLMKNNQPYQRYMEYFEVLPTENKYTGKIDYKTMIKPNGIEYIIKKLIKDGKIITKTPEQILEELEQTKVS